MTGLLDERLNQLLSDAETRLAKAPSSQAKQEPSSSIVVATSGDASLQGKQVTSGAIRQSKDGLAVREVNAPSHQTGQDNAGPGWFGMPKTDPNDKELKRDMQLLQMRGTALDLKRHYKKGSLKAKVPRFAHVGRIVEGPTDFFSARLTRKERKRTLVDELVAAEKQTGKFKAKYEDIQSRKTSGKKAFYKKVVAQRRRRN